MKENAFFYVKLWAYLKLGFGTQPSACRCVCVCVYVFKDIIIHFKNIYWDVTALQFCVCFCCSEVYQPRVSYIPALPPR